MTDAAPAILLAACAAAPTPCPSASAARRGPPDPPQTDPSLLHFAVPEACPDAVLLDHIQPGRALHTTELRVGPAQRVRVRGETLLRERGLRVKLSVGSILRIEGHGDHCPGVEVLAPRGDSAWFGALDPASPVLVAVDETGVWEVDFIGHGPIRPRSLYDATLSLAAEVPAPSPAEWQALADRHVSRLRNHPGARAALVAALGVHYDALWSAISMGGHLRLLDRRYLLATGCAPADCPAHGAWLTIDTDDGAITAALFAAEGDASAPDGVSITHRVIAGERAAVSDRVWREVEAAVGR